MKYVIGCACATAGNVACLVLTPGLWTAGCLGATLAFSAMTVWNEIEHKKSTRDARSMRDVIDLLESLEK